MLNGVCKDGLVQEAMKLFGLMREKSTISKVVVYTTVVEGFFKAWKLEDAVRIFKKMQSNGIIPNAFSYEVLTQGLCKGKIEEDSTAAHPTTRARTHCLHTISPNSILPSISNTESLDVHLLMVNV
ncbi:unnamed protein product [Fraxinus pennsylvanica]|uniref:Pentatricopeptide repeat-containing protein n=1 Tax=Fraxinus pennsylvanica TaxID=56036 RepID=A0AAD1ZH02_9LAMI|nr:unnamed protein product [Fraxinus pennsylvanica]